MTPTKALSVHVLVDVHVLPCSAPAFAEDFLRPFGMWTAHEPNIQLCFVWEKWILTRVCICLPTQDLLGCRARWCTLFIQMRNIICAGAHRRAATHAYMLPVNLRCSALQELPKRMDRAAQRAELVKRTAGMPFAMPEIVSHTAEEDLYFSVISDRWGLALCMTAFPSCCVYGGASSLFWPMAQNGLLTAGTRQLMAVNTVKSMVAAKTTLPVWAPKRECT